MAVLIQSTAVNLSEEQYQGLIARLSELLPSVPGFISHASWVDGNRVGVEEIWESREAFDAWYQGRVVPAMQGMNIDVEINARPVATVLTRQG